MSTILFEKGSGMCPKFCFCNNSCVTSYQSAVVIISLSCVIFEIFDIHRDAEILQINA